MKYPLRILAAAVIGVGTCGLSVGWAQHQPAGQPGQPPTHQPERDRDAGILPGRAPDAEHHQVSAGEANNIQGTISTATEAAMTRGQLRSVAQRLTTSDEARLSEFVDKDHPQLDALIDRLNQAWQARYDQSFSVGDRAAVYPAQIVRIQAGLTDQALAIRERGDDRAGEAGARIEGQIGDDTGVRAEIRRDDAQPAGARQSNLATVIFPAAGDLPEVHVPLVNEGGLLTDTWRIDIPLHVDGQTIHDNLVRSMNKALERQEEWPQDVNEGYRMATHVVMLALLDVDREAMPAAHRERDAQPGIGEQPDRMPQPDRPREPGMPQPAEPRPGQPGQPQPGQPQPGQPGQQPGDMPR
jgi:hypothetical protein